MQGEGGEGISLSLSLSHFSNLFFRPVLFSKLFSVLVFETCVYLFRMCVCVYILSSVCVYLHTKFCVCL